MSLETHFQNLTPSLVATYIPDIQDNFIVATLKKKTRRRPQIFTLPQPAATSSAPTQISLFEPEVARALTQPPQLAVAAPAMKDD